MTGRPAVPRPGPAADLATLREMLPSMEGHEDNCPCSVGRAHAALDRVEAELSRLREERDRLQTILTTRTYATTESGADRLLVLEARCARLQQALSPNTDEDSDAAVAGDVSLPAVLLAKVEALRLADLERGVVS